MALFIVGLTEFLTHPPFAIELTESFKSERMREKVESAMSRISDVVNKIMQISGEMNTLRCCQLS